jgi:hypothetical protein
MLESVAIQRTTKSNTKIKQPKFQFHVNKELQQQLPIPTQKSYSSGGFPLEPVLSELVMEVRDNSRQEKFLKILRIEMKNYSHHNDNGNIMNRSSMDIDLFNTNFLDEI